MKLFLGLEKVFLYPLAFIWEMLYLIRRFAYNYGLIRQNFFQVPIISVGNLTFGGTGKTPLTIWIADYLLKKNKKVMILMRGYKGRGENSTGFLKGGQRMGVDPSECGDEALLLSRRLKGASIVVGKDRSGNLDYYFDRELPDVVLLDDGHQHLKIARNLNIVLFDALMPLSNYLVAPRGYMREGFNALRDADIVIIGRYDQVPPYKVEKLERLIKGYLPSSSFCVRMCYRVTGLFRGDSERKLALSKLEGLSVICVSGIASTESFYKTVESLGAVIVRKRSFSDHHFFTSSEVKELVEEADALEASILTTEKDIVKIRRLVDGEKIFYLEIQTEFLTGEEKVKHAISRVVP